MRLLPDMCIGWLWQPAGDRRLVVTTSSSAICCDVGDGAAGDAHELVERGREHRVRVAARRPYHVVLAQPGVDQRADWRRMTDRRDAADGLPGPRADPRRIRPFHHC